MKYIVFDIETDGLIEDVSKIHCLSYSLYENLDLIEKNTLLGKSDIIDFLLKYSDLILVGHNIIRYDVPVLEKLLNIKIQNVLYDTLVISWYLYPFSKKHSLEEWGKELEIEKIKIEDWKNLSLEEYIIRCETDVEINSILFYTMMDYLLMIYESEEEVERILSYLGFKIDCLKDQETYGIDLDVRLAEQSMFDLEFELEDKIKELQSHMPKELGTIMKEKPVVMYKKDGSLSVHGQAWLELLKTLNLSEDTEIIREQPNPGSHDQLKTWLFGLGWKPMTFKESSSKTSPAKKVPQISLPNGQGICPSVVSMFEEFPYLKAIDGFFKAKHRQGIFKGFLECVDKKGKIYSTAHGFTNTLRLQHSKPVVNLPQVGKYYGKEVRGCLVVPNDAYIMIGADLSGLEDNTKQHFIYFFDSENVKEMRVEDFDPHLDIGMLAGLLTEEEADFYKEIDKKDPKEVSSDDLIRYAQIKAKRYKAKTVNFAATYGASPQKIAETLRCPLSEAKKLHEAYWDRNKAVKQIANVCRVKKVNGQSWLLNPISNFWMFLKAEKDRFSTLNQSSGVYVFDTWLFKVRKKLLIYDIHVVLQYHDELLLICEKEDKSFAINALKEAIKDANEELGLNVYISISISMGKNYAECH